MAFTQEQKNNLELLEKTPDVFLEKVRNGSINLSEYKDEYARGGIGLSHYLIEFLSKDSEKYNEVANEIWNNSSVSIGDFYKENMTPIGYAFSLNRNLSHFYADNKEALNTLFNIVKISSLNINDEDFSQVLYTFFMNEDFDKFNLLLDQRKKITSNVYSEKIFEKIITENDIDQLKNIAEKLEDKNDLTRVEWALQGRNYGKKEEKSNLLICAIRYSEEIANYFLDEFKFPLSGKVKFDIPDAKNNYQDLTAKANLYRTDFPSHTREDKKIIYSSTNPLNEARETNKVTLFNKILNKLGENSISHLMYKEQITKKMVKEKKQYSYMSNNDMYEPSNSIINHILSDTQSEFYNSVKTNINSVIKNTTNIDKINFISHILENKDLDYKEKLFFAKSIIPNMGKVEKIKEDYSYRRKSQHVVSYILDTFLNDLYIKKELSFKDINFSSEILGLSIRNPNLAFSNKAMYSPKLYTNNDLLNGFIAAGLDISKDYSSEKTVNPFYFYYQLTNNEYGYHSDFTKENVDKINKNFNTLKLIGGDNLYLPFPAQEYGNSIPNKNLLNYALSKLAPLLINNFTDEEIIKLSTNQPEIYPVSSIASPFLDRDNKANEEHSKTYRDITKRMFNLGFKFFNEDKPDDFYKLLAFHNDTEFLSDVLQKENKNIHELSKDINFWKYVNNEEISQYVSDKGADFSSLEMTLNIADISDFERKSFELYINQGGNINYKNEDKDNILHYLVKNNLYKQASHVIKAYPELSEQINKQNKIPLQYMMVSLNREAALNQYARSDFFPAQKEFFENYLDVGNFSDNKKSLKFLNEQVSKYYNIEKLVPHLKEIMSYKIIDAVTKPDPDEKKTKTRNKI